MDIQKQRDFLTSFAYWAIITAGCYLALEYLLPICMPILLGILLAWLVVWISRKIRCTHRIARIVLSVLIYGILGLAVALLAGKTVSALSGLVKWLPELYENKLLPFVETVYAWFQQNIPLLDPTLLSMLEMLVEGAISSLKTVISSLSATAVNLVSGLATGLPNLVFALLAMIFTTVFLVADYENIASFADQNVPTKVKRILKNIRIYLTDTLFVVIRSYVLIMLLTFTELSILFSLFGIEHAVVKAAAIAVFDIMPILGTGGIMVPWAITSLVLGYTSLGLELILIYAIVTVIRNYVEPKIVGAQLSLHPIITLVAMFVGLRVFGFWGLFGLPVGISFLWKQKNGEV